MNKICKIGIGAAALAGVATVSSAVAERFRKKWFLRGFEAGQFVGNLTAVECFAQEKTAIKQKYDNLCEDYAELERAYNELCAETDDE